MAIQRLLIQRAKCYLTIIKLQPYSLPKNNQFDLIPAMKGNAIHMPIPMERTHDHIQETLPCLNNSRIIVDSLPSKLRKNLFRSMVDLNKVKMMLYNI